MSTQIIHWLPVGEVDDIPVRGARCVDIDGQRIALFRTASNEVFALRDECPHKAGPLSQGIVHGDCVTCPLHNWVISLRDGTAQGADQGSTQRYPVRQDGAQLLLGVDKETMSRQPNDSESVHDLYEQTSNVVSA